MKRTQGQVSSYVVITLSLLLSACTSPGPSHSVIPPSAVVGVKEAQLQPEFWIARESNAKKVVLDSRQIAEQNA